MTKPFSYEDAVAPAAPASAGFSYEDATGEPKKPEKAPGLARGAADSLIAFGSGVTSSVQSLANVAGADNPVSQGLGKATKFLTDMDSPERKAEKQNRAATIKKAEESGSTWEEVKAYGGAFAEAPLDTTLNALGTSVPTLAAAFLTGGASVPAQVAARALPKVIGVAQGTGAVKGQIYEAVEQEHLKAGKTPEEAAALAAKAQAYDGKNAGQIALGGVFGGVAAGIGAEAALRRFVGGKVAGEAGKEAAMGIGKAAGLGVLKETPVEMLQGGQERVASNLALQNEGFDTPTWRGVGGQAFLDGLASAPMGAGFGMLDARGGPTVNPNTAAEPPAQPPAPQPPNYDANALQALQQTRLDALASEEAGAPDVPQVPPPDGAAALAAQTERANRARQAMIDLSRATESPDDEILQSTGMGTPPMKPSVSMGIDPNAGVISKVAAEAVDGPASMEMAVRQAERDMAALAAEDNPEAGADTLTQADPTVDDLFPPPQGAANASNADAAGALAAGTGGRVGADTAGGGSDAGLLEAATGQRAAGDAAAPGPTVQESDAAPVPGRDSDKALTKGPTNTKAKVKGLKDVIARNKAAKANVQDQPQGTAPAAAPAPAPAVQAPQAVGSDGVAQPGAASAGRAGVEADGVAVKKQEFKVEGSDPHTVSYAQRPDGRLVRTINYPDGQSSTDTLVTDKKGDETWVSNDRYAKGEFYPKQLSPTDAEQAIREDMAGKPAAPAPAPAAAPAAAQGGKPVKAIVLDAPVEQALQAVKDSPSAQTQPTKVVPQPTTEPTNGTQASEAIPQETGREETALLSDSVSTDNADLRDQLRKVEDQILQAVPGYMAQGGGDIEAAMKSRKVPTNLKMKRNAIKKKLQEQRAEATSAPAVAPTVAKKLFTDPRTGMPVVVSNKATADAFARSKQLAGKATVRKATPDELADERNAFAGYSPGEARRIGYVLEVAEAPAAPAVAAPAPDKDARENLTSTSQRERDLRALSHEKEQPSDVMLGNDRFVTLEQAKAAAQAAIDEGVLRADAPFQYNRILDIAPRDWQRMVLEMTGKPYDIARPADAPAPSQQAQAPAATEQTATQPTELGRNNQPISEGGKPFKSRADADAAKKLQPLMRVKKVNGGFVLAEKTPAQIAAQAKAAKRLGSVGNTGPLAAHELLASLGGLSKSTMADLGFDRNVRVGARWLFSGAGGLTLERATEALQQYGYMDGTDQAQAISIIQRSAKGQPQYTAEGWDQVAKAEAETRYADHLAAQEEAAQEEDFDPFASLADDGYPIQDVEASGIDEAAPEVLTEVLSGIDHLEAIGQDLDSITERIALQYPEASQQEYHELVQAAINQAIEGAAQPEGRRDDGEVGSRQAPATEAGAGQDAAEGDLLTAPTRADIEAQQDRADAAARQEDADRQRAEQQDAAARERAEVARRSAAAADTFELGQDPLDNLTGQQPMFSRAKAKEIRNLVTLHNMTEANLEYSDSLGGMPVPSLGITKVDAPFSGFGNITLIGDKSLADPEQGVPVFDRDAWTARFPTMNFKKPRKAKADAFFERMKAMTNGFGVDESNFLSNLWESMVNASVTNPDKVADHLRRYDAPRMAYARDVLGRAIKVPMRDARLSSPAASDKQLQAYWKKNGKRLVELERELSGFDFVSTPEYKAFMSEIEGAIRRYADSTGNARRADSYVETFLPDGELGAGGFYRLSKDFEQVGKKEVDGIKLREAVDKVVKPNDPAYLRWVQEQVKPLFDAPTITLRGKEVEPTLDNIVEAMTTGAVQGVEKSMTFGPGKLAAHLGKRFKSLAEIKAARDQVVSESAESEAKKATDALLDEFRTHVAQFFTFKDWRGNIDTWAANDASMEALARAGKQGLTDANIRLALARKDFKGVDQRGVDLARQAIEALRDTATNYFEAKPQRAVKISEFKGAVVPKDISPDSLAILEKNGITVEFYGKADGAREKAIEKLAKRLDRQSGDVVFSRAAAAGSMPIQTAQQIVDTIKARWKNAPEVIVLADMNDPRVPEAVRKGDAEQRSGGATGEPEGFYYKGTAYVVAGSLKTPGDVVRVLLHESLGHHGLRGVFGDGLKTILKQIATMRKSEVQAKAAEYGLDMEKESDRLQAAEEVLAVMAQNNPQAGFVKRAIGAIRAWLRENVPGLQNMRMTDNDIVTQFILPARRFVQQGPAARVRNGVVAMSRSDNAGMLQTTSTSPAVTKLNRVMRGAGWEIEYIELDLTGEKPKVAIRVNRDDGRFMIAKVDSVGRASFETFQRERALRMDGSTKGRRPLTPMVDDTFLGRQKFEGARSMLRGMVNYLVDNASNPVALSDMKSAWAGAMAAPVQQDMKAVEFAPTSDGAMFSRGDNGRMTDTPAFRKWFGDSKVVDADGKPLVVYHGTSNDFTAFDSSKVKGRFPNSEGFYFTSRPMHASVYADSIDNAVNDFDPASPFAKPVADGANVVPAYVSLQNPKLITVSEWGTLESSVDGDGGARVRAARAAGHDGVIVTRKAGDAYDGQLVIAFRPEQIKSATGNNGQFDPENPDIRFSRSPRELAGMATDQLNTALKSVTITSIKQAAGYKATDLMGIALGGLGRRQLVEIYGKDLPLDKYNELATQMEADKNEYGAEADSIATEWGKLKDEGALANIMHDATLAKIDPDKPLQPGDDPAAYNALKMRFSLMSKEAKETYRKARDGYKRHHANVREAIKERIERSQMSPERRAALVERMDSEFFAAMKGVYFPLARFGKYVVVVRGADGKVETVARSETMAEAAALRRNLVAGFPAAKGYQVDKVILSREFVASRDAVGRGFMQELYQVLDKQDMDPAMRAEMEDTLGQLYLSSLPDVSWAKHGIHRKGTPGFSQDARRAFAQNMFHGARYLAKLRYSDLMQTELKAMQDHVDKIGNVLPDEDGFNGPRMQRVVDEFYKRHDSLMNPNSHPWSTALTSIGFMFHLGLSPASALVNLTQTAFVAYPVMAAKWGFGKAGVALLKASKQAAMGKNDITKFLNRDERRAYDEAVRAGTIDVTMAHDLAGIAQGEDAGVMWRIRPAMRAASFLFHHAERFNRQATFVAAYRLAREAGTTHEVAFEQATKATYDGHFDYSSGNRPRFMQGNTAKVILLFKSYAQNMVYTLARNAYQSVNGLDPKERAEARKALAGILATHAMAAGVLGLPMVTTILAAISAAGSDDDEPFDAQVALQNMLADTFGQKPAEVITRGLSRLTPWDISGRVGLDRLIFPDVQEGLEGQRLAESAAFAALGPVAGIFANFLKGVQEISEGHMLRGITTMMPAALRGPLNAVRLSNEGAQDKTGITIVDEVDAAAVFGQALGFSPSVVRQATEGKRAVLSYDRALNERRQELMTQYARGAMKQDAEAMQEAREAIQTFNEKNPGRRITMMQLHQSVRNRERRIDQADNGVYLPKNRREAMDQGRFALSE